MSRNTSVALGQHFVDFIDTQVQGGRYGTASDVVRAYDEFLASKVEAMFASRRASVLNQS